MSNDEHNFEVNGNHPLPIDPELEARIVAWVAGEASPFEAAELERLVAEKPEIAAFKREIEEMSGLIAIATAADAEPLRLAPERRGKVLSAIGAQTEVLPLQERIAKLPKIPSAWSWKGPRFYYAISAAAAACIAILLTVSYRTERIYGARATLQFEKPDTVVNINAVTDTSVHSDVDLNTRMKVLEAMAGPNNDLSKLNWEKNKEVIAQAWKIAKAGEEAKRPARPPTQTLLGRAAGPSSQGAPTEITFAPVSRFAGASQPAAAAPAFLSGGATVKDAPALSLQLSSNGAGSITFGNGASVGGIGGARGSILDLRTASVPVNLPPADEIVHLSPFTASAERTGSAQASGSTASVTRGLTDVDVQSALKPVTLHTPGGILAANDAKKAATKQLSTEQSIAGLELELARLKSADGERTKDRLAQERGERQRIAKNRAEEAKAKAEQDKRPIALPAAASPIVMDNYSFAVPAGGGLLESRKDVVDEKLRDANLAFQEAAIAGGKPSELLTVALNQPSSSDVIETGLAGSATVTSAATLNLRLNAPAETVKETDSSIDAVSTFSLHVSDVSFRLAQAALAKGERPADAKIRPEEFYNAFDYGDPAPSIAEKIGCRIEQAAHPFLQQRNLVRLAMKVAATGRGAGQPLHLTVLLDTSGSMEREDRVEAVRRAMAVLVSLLGPNDRLTLIGFARQPRLLAENVAGDQARALLDIVARTPAEGGTNIEEALKLGRDLALRHRDAAAQNRIVVLTDGAANLGDAQPARLMEMVEGMRQQGIAFDACGVGLEGVGDTILEALTRKGNGRYYVLDSAETADAAFARQLAGAFRPAAENVKLQVRFNPARVGRYRLIGFEEHRLREEDFRNDQVDAAELAAEEAANALYQVEVKPEGSGEIGEVFVRFRDAASGQMVERSWTIPFDPQAPSFDRATPSLQLAGVAALMAEKLQGSALAANFKLRDLSPVVSALRTHYSNEPRVQELVTMFNQLRRISGE